jgi:hypothetical protein
MKWIKASSNVKSFGFLFNSRRYSSCETNKNPGPGSYENTLDINSDVVKAVVRKLVNQYKVSPSSKKLLCAIKEASRISNSDYTNESFPYSKPLSKSTKNCRLSLIGKSMSGMPSIDKL